MKRSAAQICFLLLLCAGLLLSVLFLLPATADASGVLLPGYSEITRTEVNIEIPYGYRKALFTAEVPYGAGYHISDFTGTDAGFAFYNGICWYDETGKRSLSPGDSFVTGRIYTVRILYRADENKYFRTYIPENSVNIYQSLDVYLNGMKVNKVYRVSDGNINFHSGVQYTFEACSAAPAEIRSVNILGLDTPYDLNTPDFTVTAEGPHYSVDTERNLQSYSYRNGVNWVQELGNGYTYDISRDSSNVFARGNVYTVRVLVKAEYPYRFLLSYDGTKADITGYIKGYRCEVLPADGYDPNYYCILKYTFPACPYALTQIKSANIEDIEIPVAGATPDYDVTPDIGFFILDDEGSVIKNGICWYDETDQNFLKPTDVFVKDHVYSISVGLQAAEGYLFYDDEDGDCLTECAANGNRNGSYGSRSSSGPGLIYYEFVFSPAVEPDPVKITTQPKTTYTKLGATAKATVTATGDGLTYQWYIKNAGATKYSKSSITSATYSCKMSDSSKDRLVYCVVTDKYGNTDRTETVRLRMAATITVQPVSVTVASGEQAKVTLTAVGDGLTYTWYYKDAGMKSFTKTTSFTGPSYYISMTDARDGRQVYCVITDKYGKTVKSNTVTLNMQ